MDEIVCRYFVSTGGCKLGSLCPFPHVMEPSRMPDTVCRYFIQGNCDYGDLCWFEHKYLPFDNVACGYNEAVDNNEVRTSCNCNTAMNAPEADNSSEANSSSDRLSDNPPAYSSFVPLPCVGSVDQGHDIVPVYICYEYYDTITGNIFNSCNILPVHRDVNGIPYCFLPSGPTQPEDNFGVQNEEAAETGTQFVSEDFVYYQPVALDKNSDNEMRTTTKQKTSDKHLCNIQSVSNESHFVTQNQFCALAELNNGSLPLQSQEHNFRDENIHDNNLVASYPNTCDALNVNVSNSSSSLEDVPRSTDEYTITGSENDVKAVGIRDNENTKEDSGGPICNLDGNSSVAIPHRDNLISESESHEITYEIPDMGKELKQCSNSEKEINEVKSNYLVNNRYTAQQNNLGGCLKHTEDKYESETNDLLAPGLDPCQGHSTILVDNEYERTDFGKSSRVYQNPSARRSSRNKGKANRLMQDNETEGRSNIYYHTHPKTYPRKCSIDASGATASPPRLSKSSFVAQNKKKEDSYANNLQVEITCKEDTTNVRYLKCNMCQESVIACDRGRNRYGMLENCEHIFCLKCIYPWKSVTNSKTVFPGLSLTCPNCGVVSPCISAVRRLVGSQNEKKELIDQRKKSLKQIPCKFFKRGRGKCANGKSCLYLHNRH